MDGRSPAAVTSPLAVCPSATTAACCWRDRLKPDTFHNRHIAPQPSREHSHRGEAHPRPKLTEASVPGPVIHRCWAPPSRHRAPFLGNRCRDARFLGAFQIVSFKVAGTRCVGSPLTKEIVTNPTQEKTQRVFKGEGNGTRFIQLRATQQRTRNAGGKLWHDLES